MCGVRLLIIAPKNCHKSAKIVALNEQIMGQSGAKVNFSAGAKKISVWEARHDQFALRTSLNYI